ncbi:MAG: prolyl-tRNA synthetase associated domain-containing protein [Bacteroidaceae bacterium]|nr:prolyl-tRNA synthetase associated domain-containing protein [Bacteroidaceae bacterium]
MLKIELGRPADETDRHPREIRVYDFLDKLGIEYERIDHHAANSMEVCGDIDQTFQRMTLQQFKECPAAERAGHAIICKNLFLCNRQETKLYLLMIPGDKRFVTKDLSAQINSSRLSFASPELMLKYLDVLPGSVSVFGLLNDTENRVQLLIDSDLYESNYVGCHPCMNTSSMRIRLSDLKEKILPALHHKPIIVKL